MILSEFYILKHPFARRVAVAPAENEITFLKRDRVFFYWRRGGGEARYSYSSSDNGKERI
jgi:hypothetical protein